MCAARHAHAVPLLALRCINSGSLAIFAAIRRASSLVSSLAAERRPWLILEIDIGELLSVVIADNEATILSWNLIFR
jgi:hypothetical protein